jgi:hypothetical protein
MRLVSRRCRGSSPLRNRESRRCVFLDVPGFERMHRMRSKKP